MSDHTLLQRIPNTIFGVPLGLAAQANMLKVLHLSPWAKDTVGDAGIWVLWVFALVWVSVIFPMYFVKCILHPRLVLFETSHPVRGYFAYIPHLLIVLLTLSAPPDLEEDNLKEWQRTIFVIAAVPHTCLATLGMSRWMFDDKENLQRARAPFLINPIGWVLLCILGQVATIKDAWGIDLPAFCFGAAVYTFYIAAVSIMQNLSNKDGRSDKGSPALYLLIAPPALASVCFSRFEGKFGTASTCALGLGLFLEITVITISHNLIKKPKFLGSLAAYTLAPAALAGSAIAYANEEDRVAAKVLAVAQICISLVMLVTVYCVAARHHIGVLMGTERWDDPLLMGFEKVQAGEAQAKSGEQVPTTNNTVVGLEMGK